MSDVKTEAEKLIAEVRVKPEFCKVGTFAANIAGRWAEVDGDATPVGFGWDGHTGWTPIQVPPIPQELHDKYPDLWKHTKFQVTAKDLASYTDLTSTDGEVAKQSQTVTNDQGGMQSHIEARFDLVPPNALKLVAECLGFGDTKYPEFEDGTPNWHKIPAADHLNHLIAHANAYQRGDATEQHPVNLATRAMMFLETLARDEETASKYWHPEMSNQTVEVK